jgi:hypothetical protein
MNNIPHLDAAADWNEMVLMVPQAIWTKQLAVAEKLRFAYPRDFGHPIYFKVHYRPHRIGNNLPGVHSFRQLRCYFESHLGRRN